MIEHIRTKVSGDVDACARCGVFTDPDGRWPEGSGGCPENPDRDLYDEIGLLKATVTRLNRRCQSYESALTKKIAEHPGRTFGRTLANAAATMYKTQLEAALVEIERYKEIAREANAGARTWSGIAASLASKETQLKVEIKRQADEIADLRKKLLVASDGNVAYTLGYTEGMKVGRSMPDGGDE